MVDRPVRVWLSRAEATALLFVLTDAELHDVTRQLGGDRERVANFYRGLDALIWARNGPESHAERRTGRGRAVA